ncbi:type VII secretion target [Saccharopolyspora gregorii]|uniref:ESX-1 secretion-associated protein n=1 Tax=Saccharopolyspora gregorii TaxID=33914 RepID=A0ABP6RX23_9PSEU|nr:type VII secretion target [Saccharopolyspora gregorii]
MAYEVVSEDLAAHAAHLDALTDRIDTAISAAEQVSMSDEAYGLLCSFLPPIINPTEQEGIAALQAAREGIETTAQNVRTSAEEYDTNDEDNSQSFQKLHGTVPEGSEQFQLMSGGAGPTGQQQGTLPGDASEQQQGTSPTGFSQRQRGTPPDGMTEQQRGTAPRPTEQVQAPTAMNAPHGGQVQAPTAMNAPHGGQVLNPAVQGHSQQVLGTTPRIDPEATS